MAWEERFDPGDEEIQKFWARWMKSPRALRVEMLESVAERVAEIYEARRGEGEEAIRALATYLNGLFESLAAAVREGCD